MAVRKTPHEPASRQRKVRQPAAEPSPPAGRGGTASGRARRARATVDHANVTVDMAAVCAALEASGVLLPPAQFDEPPMDPAELERLEQEVYTWLDSLPEPLGLTEAVIEDRG